MSYDPDPHRFESMSPDLAKAWRKNQVKMVNERRSEESEAVRIATEFANRARLGSLVREIIRVSRKLEELQDDCFAFSFDEPCDGVSGYHDEALKKRHETLSKIARERLHPEHCERVYGIAA